MNLTISFVFLLSVYVYAIGSAICATFYFKVLRIIKSQNLNMESTR